MTFRLTRRSLLLATVFFASLFTLQLAVASPTSTTKPSSDSQNIYSTPKTDSVTNNKEQATESIEKISEKVIPTTTVESESVSESSKDNLESTASDEPDNSVTVIPDPTTKKESTTTVSVPQVLENETSKDIETENITHSSSSPVAVESNEKAIIGKVIDQHTELSDSKEKAGVETSELNGDLHTIEGEVITNTQIYESLNESGKSSDSSVSAVEVSTDEISSEVFKSSSDRSSRLLTDHETISLNAVSVDDPFTHDKPGRCPSRTLAPELCPEGVPDQCTDDSSCSGASKCCSTGCARVCIRPRRSACELHRQNTLRRGRALGVSEDMLDIPKCDEVQGTFVPIQCHGEHCFCVDQFTGYEMPGTRARSLELVNCSNPEPCAGYQCRMLCPYQFQLDKDGCPVCRCRDPCEGVRCPSGHSCALEEAPCDSEPCPPLAVCKEPRSLKSLCPIGDPLMLDDDAKRPFLCGTDPGKPTCPSLYTCNVNTAAGHDYGVCCTNADRLNKAGSCPIDTMPQKTNTSRENKKLPTSDVNEQLLAEVEAIVKEEVEELRCGVSCSHDLQCPSTQKCCMSDICGQHCIQPANLTACLHQRMIAELLIVSENEGKGYIPQCREYDGLFEAKQCSRNGLVCWCSDEAGNKVSGSMGAADEVTCENNQMVAQSRLGCPELQCDALCEWGYETDNETGCSGCSCADPCLSMTCKPGEVCVMGEKCGRGGCSDMPACIPENLFEYTSEHQKEMLSVTPSQADKKISETDNNLIPYDEIISSDSIPLCPLGLDPLTVGGLLLECSTHDPCPQDYTCSMSDTEKAVALCCPIPTEIESTKLGQCPFITSYSASMCSPDNICSSDDHCSDDMKCCVVPACDGPVCVPPMNQQNYSSLDQSLLQGPTMCEYLRDLVEIEGVELAIPTPGCDYNGAYDQVQCNKLGQCWCVDDYGSLIPGTKVSSRDLLTCDKLRESTAACGEVLCRLGCDYGYVLDTDTACPLCMCRDPCEGVECNSGQNCELVDIPCIDGVCPPVPQCINIPQRDLGHLRCPNGEAYTIPGTNKSLSCSPRARAIECPMGYSCLGEENEVEGICCISATVTPEEKVGQCPYLVPMGSQSCDMECTKDSQCKEHEKCCSNGCGMHCVQPLVKTACQHQRSLLEHRAREASIPAGKVYLPQCDEEGNFYSRQCHPATTTCWCVDDHGLEVPGTRVSEPATPDCERPATCPAIACELACTHGNALDNRGCPMCACHNPCADVRCSSPFEECRVVHVACVSAPCPPLPVCLPKLTNPCPIGSPLNINGTLMECGPEGSVCPSSHKCHLSPLGEYALCCKKPREVCYQARDSGFCEGSIKRWYFDPQKNQCHTFRFGGCGGNLNNFETEEECKNSCPVLSSCERMKAKNEIKAQRYNRMTFMPKCNKSSGKWMPKQCLDELGVCWCVNPEGNQIEGSLTRGDPRCDQYLATGRSARKLDLHRSSAMKNNKICDLDKTVHVCNKNLCENKVCLGDPSATCRINPCGGCSILFVDEFNTPIDCNEGLTNCQKELQKLLNTPALDKPITDEVLQNLEKIHDISLYFSPTQEETSNALYNGVDSSKGEKNDRRPEVTVYGSPVRSSASKVMGRKSRSIIVEDNNGEETVIDDYNPTQDLSSKPGTCPSPSSDANLLNCQPREECLEDDHCEGSAKCCFTGCGSACMQPQEMPASSSGMTASLPQCEGDGSYSRTQTSGPFSWCVDSKGHPLHETLTRGHVRCGPNGQILERSSSTSVCPPRPGIVPRVCRDSCLSSSCPAHPDAVCVSDPCNDCRVSFYSPNGEKVHCSERCSQPLATGMCRASFNRFFYNTTSERCEEFLFGGCQGNDNNFVSFEECSHACHKPKSVCSLPVNPGRCSGGEAKWFYNIETRTCDPFLYTGCHGNANNFNTKMHCESVCPDEVLCPFWSSLSMEPEACSRISACANATCHGHPDAVCNVDPCKCAPYFTDRTGQSLECLMPTPAPKTILAFSYEQDLPDGLSTEVFSNQDSSSTVYLVGEPNIGRCELLRRYLKDTDDKVYSPQCDSSGNFHPTQCYSKENVPQCWCVDETGKKTHPNEYFKVGEKECQHVLVESVVVTLGFHGHKMGIDRLGHSHEQHIRQQIAKILHSVGPALTHGRVTVMDLPDVTQVKFTLKGDTKIDAAFQLEEKVRQGNLFLHIPNVDKPIPADMKASWFHHQVSPPTWSLTNRQYSNRRAKAYKHITSAREVVSRLESAEPPFLAASVVVSVLSAILVCSLVVAAVLYKRHLKAVNARRSSEGSMTSLAFSDSSLDRSSFRCSKFTQLDHPDLDARVPTVNTIESEYRAATRH